MDGGVEAHEEVDAGLVAMADAGGVVLQRLAGRLDLQVGGKLHLQLAFVSEREFRRVGLHEKIERVEDRELGGQVDLDFELFRLLREHEPRQPIAVRVLLPIDEMLRGRDFKRIGRHLRAAMRRRTEPDRLRPERDQPIVFVVCDVVQSGENGQTERLPNLRRDDLPRKSQTISAAGRRACQRQATPRYISQLSPREARPRFGSGSAFSQQYSDEALAHAFFLVRSPPFCAMQPPVSAFGKTRHHSRLVPSEATLTRPPRQNHRRTFPSDRPRRSRPALSL